MAKKIQKKKNKKAMVKPKAKAKAKAAVKKVVVKKSKPVAKAKAKAKAKPVSKKTKPVAKAKQVKPVAKVKPNGQPVAKEKAKPTLTKKETAKELKARLNEQAIANKAMEEANFKERISTTPLMNFKKREQAAKRPPVEQVLPEEANRVRYSDDELEEFRGIILKKLDEARKELNNLTQQMINANENGTDDTAGTFKMLEEGSENLAKEEAGQLAQRQKKFIEQLEAALMRIENKTYGICTVTGKLIPKERLRAVPHTTKSIEAKLNQYRD